MPIADITPDCFAAAPIAAPCQLFARFFRRQLSLSPAAIPIFAIFFRYAVSAPFRHYCRFAFAVFAAAITPPAFRFSPAGFQPPRRSAERQRLLIIDTDAIADAADIDIFISPLRHIFILPLIRFSPLLIRITPIDYAIDVTPPPPDDALSPPRRRDEIIFAMPRHAAIDYFSAMSASYFFIIASPR